MKVELKLFASLADYLPEEARAANRLDLEVGDEATIGEVIAAQKLPPKLVHLVLLNGVFVPPALRARRKLSPGDALAIWPPIAGG